MSLIGQRLTGGFAPCLAFDWLFHPAKTWFQIDATPLAAESSAVEAAGLRCFRPCKDFACKKQESSQSKRIEDQLSYDVNFRPAGDGQVRNRHRGERRSEGRCETMDLTPGRAR